MEGIQKAFAQIGDLWGSFTPSQKGTYTMIVLLLVAAPIMFSYNGGGGAEYVSLLGNQESSPRQMRTIYEAFIHNGLSGAQLQGDQIMVPANRIEEYMKALSDVSLTLDPKDIVLNGMKEASVFGSQSRQKNMNDENRKKLAAETIMENPDVVSATVDWTPQPRRPSYNFSPGTERKGLVTVRMFGGREVTPAEIHTFSRIVANRVAGLSPENVSVSNMSTFRTHTPREDDPTDLYNRRLADERDRIRNDIKSALAYIPGVNVNVKVELEKVEQTHKRELVINPKPVVIHKETNSITESDSEIRKGGEPGNLQNQPLQVREDSGIANQRNLETNQSTQKSVVGRGTEISTVQGLRLLSSRATITVPEEFIRDRLAEEGISRPAADAPEQERTDYSAKVLAKESQLKTKISAEIQPLLTIPEGGELEQYLSISSVPSPKIEEPPGPSMMDTLGDFTSAYGRTVGLTLFALAAMYLLNRSLNGVPPTEEPDIEAILTPPAPPEDEPKVHVPEPDPPPPTRREDVQFLVRDNPEVAAAVLGKWLSPN